MMNKLQRYSAGPTGMKECDDGSWCLASEVTELERRLNKLSRTCCGKEMTADQGLDAWVCGECETMLGPMSIALRNNQNGTKR